STKRTHALAEAQPLELADDLLVVAERKLQSRQLTHRHFTEVTPRAPFVEVREHPVRFRRIASLRIQHSSLGSEADGDGLGAQVESGGVVVSDRASLGDILILQQGPTRLERGLLEGCGLAAGEDTCVGALFYDALVDVPISLRQTLPCLIRR